MMPKKKKKSKRHIEPESSINSLESRSSSRGCSFSSEMINQRFTGQLSKYTNVMKGWQYRWFALDPNSGMLYYYLSENESNGSPRGCIHLQGALICPSDEDSHTFTVNSTSGEVFKLRATDARARQEWVNKLRSVAERHTLNTNKFVSGNIAGTLMHSGMFVHGSHIHSPATSESFSSAKEHLSQAEQHLADMTQSVESLPTRGKPSCVDTDLLTLKACSHALVRSLHDCVHILQYTFAADCGFRSANVSNSSINTSNRADNHHHHNDIVPTPSFVSHIMHK